MSAQLSIQYPWVLLLLPLAAWLWPVWKSSLAPLSRTRRWTILGLRGLLMLLLVLSLADIRWHHSTQRTAVAWLVDVSDSLGETALHVLRELRETSGTPPDIERVIGFAGTAAPLGDPSSESGDLPDRQLFQPSQTRLDQAVQFASAVLPEDYVRTLFVLSDGRSSQADWNAVADRLKQQQIRVHTRTIVPPDQPEVLVQQLLSPSRVRQNEPFLLEAVLTSNREQPAQVALFRNGVLADSRQLSLTPGKHSVTFNQVIGNDKLTEFIVRVQAEQDTLLDNNERSTVIESIGEPRVLMVTDQPAQARHLAWAMRQEGILFEVRPQTGTPDSLSDLQNYELLVFDNIPASALSDRQFTLYSEWVKTFGGGFLMLGGDRSFGLGGYHRTLIDDLLPLRSEFVMQEDHPSTALILIIDKSGSMQGERIAMARQAASGAVNLLSSSDYAGVIVFDSEASWAAPLQSLQARYNILSAISGIEASGGTDLAPAMQLVSRELYNVPAQIKHVIILSDGQSSPGAYPQLTRQITQTGATVSTVAVGSGADVNLLKEIAQMGQGRFYYTESNQDVPQILAQETITASRSALHESPIAVQTYLHPDFLQEIDFQNAPFLYGHVKTELRPTAQLWLVSDEGAPLLASWRVGLGNVGAFASDARARWALEWLRWDGYNRFWVQTFRHLMRSAEARPYSLSLEKSGNSRKLSIDYLDNTGRFVSGGQGQVLLLGPANTRLEFPLTERGPGRYEADIPVSEVGNYYLSLELTAPDPAMTPLHHSMAFSTGYPDEYLLAPPDEALLQQLASQTGGTHHFEEAYALLRSDSRSALRQRELWPWLAMFALLVFLADLTFKRIPSHPTPPS